MKTLIQFIKESSADNVKIEKIAQKILDKDKKLVQKLQDETSYCPDDDFEEWQDHVVNNIEEYAGRWQFLQAIAKELRMEPYDLLDDIDWDILFMV